MGGQNYKIADIFQRDIAYYQGNHGGGQGRRTGGGSGLDHWLAGARKIAQPGVAGALVMEEIVE